MTDRVKITSVQKALAILKTKHHDSIWEALNFLQKQETSDEIIDQICNCFENVFKGLHFVSEDYVSYEVHWHAFLAEKHLDIRLIPSVISLYTQVEKNEEYVLCDHGIILIGLLCEKFGEAAYLPMLNTIETFSIKKNQHPIIYLFDCLFFVDHKKTIPQLRRILDQKDSPWNIEFAEALAQAGIKELTEEIEAVFKYHKETLKSKSKMLVDLEIGIQLLKGEDINPLNQGEPYYKNLSDWEKRFGQFYISYLDEMIEISQKAIEENEKLISENSIKLYGKEPSELIKNLGRNDPCFCGSGKKYKKCCLD